jgi:1,4-alpha-glucan branching enzyme
MISVIKEHKVLAAHSATQLQMDATNKVIVFERSNLIFIFNFHINNSIFGYKFYVPQKGIYKIILNSDKKEFGGFDRVDDALDYETSDDQMLSLYLTNRTAMVLKKQ